MPTVRLIPRPGLTPTVIVEFLAVPGVRYEIEVATPETPALWTRAHTLSTNSVGLRAWAVPETDPVTNNLLIRVRVSLL